MDEDKIIEHYLDDTLLEKPHGFSVGGRHFFLYPVTFGKMYILKDLITALEINMQYVQANLQAEALRLAHEKRRKCLNVIYCHTCKTKDEIFDQEQTDERIRFFDENMSDSDIATLMILVLTADRTETFIKRLGIDKEHEDLKKVMKVKQDSDKNNFTFGGLSVYGSFIHPLLEMGFSWDEIFWVRSYTNLRLLLADKVNSVYLSDDERKKVNITRDRERVNGDNREEILRAIQSESWE